MINGGALIKENLDLDGIILVGFYELEDVNIVNSAGSNRAPRNTLLNDDSFFFFFQCFLKRLKWTC